MLSLWPSIHVQYSNKLEFLAFIHELGIVPTSPKFQRTKAKLSVTFFLTTLTWYKVKRKDVWKERRNVTAHLSMERKNCTAH